MITCLVVHFNVTWGPVGKWLPTRAGGDASVYWRMGVVIVFCTTSIASVNVWANFAASIACLLIEHS